jgi:cytochrome c-type biogenesis protein
MISEALGVALAYAAGALSTLSPCVLPLLPIILLGVIEQHAWGPVALVAGLSISFAVIGIFVATLGYGIGLDPAALRLGVAALLVAVGVVLLVPAFQARLAHATGAIATGGQLVLDRCRPSGLAGQFLIGAALGAIWVPCSGPTLGAAVGLAAQGGTATHAAIIMTAFGIGASTPILALAYGSRRAVRARGDRLKTIARIGKPVMGVTLVGLGTLVLTGLDKAVETSLTNAMPDWLLAVTTRL